MTKAVADRRSVVLFAGLPVMLLALAAALAAGSAQAQTASGDAAQPSHVATFWREGDPGDRLMLSGRVLSAGGRPIAGAVMDLRQADATGNYRSDAYRGRIRTDAQGRYEVRTVVPESYYGARHIHITVSHGNEQVDTRVLFKGDPNLPQANIEEAIVLELSRVEDEPVYIGTFDIVMPGS
jgi:protocatechuate 3,4-dioxygenase beta subunit